MVKGISRRVVVLDAPDGRFFEQAIFIVRNDASERGVSAQELVEEARRVARACAERTLAPPKNRRRSAAPLLCALFGAVSVALAWALVVLLK